MRIEVGITHQIQIDGEAAWIKLSIAEDFAEGTDMDNNIDYLSGKANEAVIKVIEDTVNTVTNYTKDQS